MPKGSYGEKSRAALRGEVRLMDSSSEKRKMREDVGLDGILPE
jgi:hypothetical protein